MIIMVGVDMVTSINRVQSFLIAFVVVLTVFLSPAQAKEEFFSLRQVKPGMNGVGYTVFQGTKIEKFDVEVITVVNGVYGDQPLILVRLSGKLLEENGGLAAGMSGSPVYFKGKLAGSISYGFENADPMLAMVTPIQTMLELLPQRTAVNFNSMVYEGMGLIPVATPVMVSGMGQRGFELMSRALESHQLKPFFSPGFQKSSKSGKPLSVRPGSAIAVQLVSGDYQASAIGTVTWTDKDHFLAFGHPFMNRGRADYNAFQAEVFQTVRSSVLSFKMGAATDPIGKIIEDRNVGILGKFGENPQMIDVIVAVKDLDRRLTHTSRFQVIDNEQIYPEVIIAGTTAAIDKGLNRVGQGSARVTVTLQLSPNQQTVVRRNFFFGNDIALSCLREVKSLLTLVAGNEFIKVNLHAVKIDVDIEEKQSTARIVKLEPLASPVRPGSKTILNAEIRTYRGTKVEIPFQVTIPSTLKPGKLLFTLRGGADLIFEEKAVEGEKTVSKPNVKPVNSFEEMINDYLATPKNNQLVLEYFPDFIAENENSNANGKMNVEPNFEPVRQIADADYYILGDAQVMLDLE